MELSQSQESEDSCDLRVQLVDTSDSNHKGNLGLGWDIQRSREFGLSSQFGLLIDSILVVLEMSL